MWTSFTTMRRIPLLAPLDSDSHNGDWVAGGLKLFIITFIQFSDLYSHVFNFSSASPLSTPWRYSNSPFSSSKDGCCMLFLSLSLFTSEQQQHSLPIELITILTLFFNQLIKINSVLVLHLWLIVESNLLSL